MNYQLLHDCMRRKDSELENIYFKMRNNFSLLELFSAIGMLLHSVMFHSLFCGNGDVTYFKLLQVAVGTVVQKNLTIRVMFIFLILY